MQSLQFVELKKFLPDNIKLYKKLEAFNKSTLASVPPHLRPNYREIPNLATWLFCYAQYVAVLAEKHPDLVKSRLAYMCLIIHEARKRGGKGWLEYDTLFWQHAAEDDLDEGEHPLDWSKLDASLHSCMAGVAHDGSLCLLCGGSDHKMTECALQRVSKAPSQSPIRPNAQPYYGKNKARASSSSVLLCIQWNKGDCQRANCRYHHSCATCPGSHRACDCPQTPMDSFYRRGVKPTRQDKTSNDIGAQTS